MGEYQDRWIRCTPSEIEIRWYYFPWGTKRIPYSAVRAVRRIELGTFSGKWRIWGSTLFKYWANLDPQRPKKTAGLVLDVGTRMSPLLTPDDVEAAEAVIRSRAGLEPATGTTPPGPAA